MDNLPHNSVSASLQTPQSQRLTNSGWQVLREQFLGWVIALLCLLSLVPACARYQFGSPTLHTAQVSSVHIDLFENDTYRRGLGPWLTEAVAREVQNRTPYRIADAQTADSFLRGRLVSDRKSVVIESPNDDARDLNYAQKIEITWTDRTGMPLTASRVITITEDANLIPEGGQSLTSAQQDLIQRLARQVVNQMEVYW